MSAGILGMGVLAPAANGIAALDESLSLEPPLSHRLASLPELAEPRLRRLPRLERMALAVAREALGPALAAPSLGLVFGTGMGGMVATTEYLEGIASRGASFGSPTAFHQSVHHSPAGQLSIALGLRGASLTVSSRELSGETALRVGLDLLESGRADQVLVVSADEWAPALSAGYRAFGVVAEEGAPPRAGLSPGEGAAALLLGRAPSALKVHRCQISAHPTAVLHFARPEHFPELLNEELSQAASGAFFSLAGPTQSLRERELAAVHAASPGLAWVNDVERTGFHASAGLVRVVLAALRLQRTPAPTKGFVHGLALGGGQALTTLSHVPR